MSDIRKPEFPHTWGYIQRVRLFLDASKDGGLRTLRRHRGEFYQWRDTKYQPISDETVKARLYRYFDDAVVIGDGLESRPYRPAKPEIEKLFDALKAEAALPDHLVPPCWIIAGMPLPEAREMVAFENALVHLPTGETLR